MVDGRTRSRAMSDDFSLMILERAHRCNELTQKGPSLGDPSLDSAFATLVMRINADTPKGLLPRSIPMPKKQWLGGGGRTPFLGSCFHTTSSPIPGVEEAQTCPIFPAWNSSNLPGHRVAWGFGAGEKKGASPQPLSRGAQRMPPSQNEGHPKGTRSAP